MPHRLPERLFHPLQDLSEYWHVALSDIRQWLAGGQMTAVLWLPLMSVIQGAGCENEDDGLQHWKGYVRMSEHQCERIFRQGWIALREFVTMDGKRRFRLPESSHDLIATLDDLVVLEGERKRMETRPASLAIQL